MSSNLFEGDDTEPTQLATAEEEAMMKEVGRILYVHVPTAWVSLSTFLIAFIFKR